MRIVQRRRTGAAMVVVLALAGSAALADPVPAGPGSAQALERVAHKPHRTTWELGELTSLNLVPREAATSLNDHPAQVDAEALRRNLAMINLATGEKDEPLFAKTELGTLVEPIREALALAEPEEDLVLLSSNRRGGGFLTAPTTITARLFLREGRLNVIVRDTRLDIISRYRVDQVMPRIRFGSRSEQGTSALRGAGIEFRRSDWMVFPLQATPVAGPSPAPAITPAPVPGPIPPIPAKAHGSDFYVEQEARLKALKRMRDGKLITEDEYQAKKKEVLKSF